MHVARRTAFFARASRAASRSCPLRPIPVREGDTVAVFIGAMLFHIFLEGKARMVLEAALEGAQARLGHPRCEQLFSDFTDRAGRQLAERLRDDGRRGAEQGLGADPPDRAAPQGTWVRPIGKVVADAVQDGIRRSPAFRGLVDRLEHSDVIVYIRAGACPNDQSIACLSLLSATASNRFVLITLVMKAHGEPTRLAVFTNHLIAQIGHELHHAIEVADDPAVVDDASLDRHYRRAGFRPDARRSTYESESALLAGERVLRELSAK